MEENIIRNKVINNKRQKRKYWRMIRYLMGNPGKHTGKSKNYIQIIMQDLLMVDVGISIKKYRKILGIKELLSENQKQWGIQEKINRNEGMNNMEYRVKYWGMQD